MDVTSGSAGTVANPKVRMISRRVIPAITSFGGLTRLSSRWFLANSARPKRTTSSLTGILSARVNTRPISDVEVCPSHSSQITAAVQFRQWDLLVSSS